MYQSKTVLIYFQAILFLVSAAAGNIVSPEMQSQFDSYGINVKVENYTKSDRGKKLTQQDLDADLEVILDHFRQVGRKYVMMSRCKTIIIRGSHPKVAFASGRTLNFKYRTAGAVRHELFHSYDPFKFAYRYWKNLSGKDYFYVGGGRKGNFQNATVGEILNCFSSMSEFEDHFTWSYAQTNAREDIASIFNHTTDPATVSKWREKCRTSVIFREKFFTMIANCLEGTGEKYWNDLYHFTSEEWREIRNHRIDIPAYSGISIRYTKSDFRRYGEQIRTTMALMNLDPRLIRAAGIREIVFSNSAQVQWKPKNVGRKSRRKKSFQRQPEITKSPIIIINDGDVNGLLETIFSQLFMAHPSKAIRHQLNGPMKDWMILFRKCVIDVRRISIEMSKDPALFNNVMKLKAFTAGWLPENYWDEINIYQNESRKAPLYRRHFQTCGLRLKTSLPSGVSGKTCQQNEIDNAIRVLIACCSVLKTDFIRKTGIRNIVFAQNMKFNQRKVVGCVRGDTLCLDPTFVHLGRTFYYELFKAYDPHVQSIHNEWDQKPASKRASSGFVSVLARRSPLDDRADTFAWMLWDPCRTFRLTGKSPSLLRKTELILTLSLLTEDAPARLKLDYYRNMFAKKNTASGQ